MLPVSDEPPPSAAGRVSEQRHRTRPCSVLTHRPPSNDASGETAAPPFPGAIGRTAASAEQELPEWVDTDEHAELLHRLGINPTDLLGGIGGTFG